MRWLHYWASTIRHPGEQHSWTVYLDQFCKFSADQEISKCGSDNHHYHIHHKQKHKERKLSISLPCQHSPLFLHHTAHLRLFASSLLRFGLYTLFFLPGHLEFVWQTAQPCAAHTHKHITRQCKQEKTVWKPYSIPPHQESAVYLASHPLLYAITYHHHCNHFCYFWPIVFDVMEKDYGFKQEGNSMGTRRRRRKSHPKKGSAKSESCFKLRP